jgi:hypothetical protein
MFEKLAKFRQLQSWRQATPASHCRAVANDNRPHARDSNAQPAKKPRLICRWFLIEGTNRLGCQWEIEGPDGRDRSSPDNGRPAGALHKNFVELSQPKNLGGHAWLANRPLRAREAALADSLFVLHAGHSPMPSGGSARGRSCNCEPLGVNCA